MIQQTYLKCTYEDHENEAIIGFCLNKSCKEKRKCCTLCFIKKHSNHKGDCQTFPQLQQIIQNNFNVATNWQQKIKYGFKNIQEISQGIIKFLEGEKNFLIELEKNSQKENYQVNLRDLLKLKSWNHIIETSIHQLKGDSLLVLLTKIDFMTESILGNENLIKKKNEFHSIRIEQQMFQLRIKSNDSQSFKINYWVQYDKLLNDQIKFHKARKQFDINLIQLVAKDSAQIISQWYLNSRRAFELIKLTKTRWEKYLESELRALNELQKLNKEDKLYEMCEKLETFRKQIVPFMSSNLTFQLISDIIMKFQKFNEAIIYLRDSYEKQDRDLLELYSQFDNLNIQEASENQLQQNPQNDEAQDRVEIGQRPIRVIGIANTQTCKNIGHENEVIISYCFFKECKEKFLCCSKCLKNHQDHKENLKTLFKTKRLVQNQLLEIIKWQPKVEDSLKTIQKVCKNIQTILENQKIKLFALINNMRPNNIKDYLNDFETLRIRNFFISQNLGHLNNKSFQNLLCKIYFVFEALLRSEMSQNTDDQKQIFLNLNWTQNISNERFQYNNQSYDQFFECLIDNISNQNSWASEQLDFSFVLINLQTNQNLLNEVKPIIITQIELIQKLLNILVNNEEKASQILGILKKYLYTIKERFKNLQNQQEINLVSLNKEVYFYTRFNRVIRPIIQKIDYYRPLGTIFFQFLRKNNSF